MHDVESAAVEARSVAGWREILDRRHAALAEELGKAIQSEIFSGTEKARRDAARVESEAIHQALRRLRQPAENREILKILNEIAAPWAECSVVVVFENHQAVTVAIRGGEDAAPIVFEIADAPALEAAIESRDLVIALSSPTEISSALAALFESGAGFESGSARTYLFPVSARQSVRAILIAAGSVVPAPVEVLCEAAGMKLEVAERENASGLISIAPVPSGAESSEQGPGRVSWNELSADDQRLHLQAQRMARVRVATLRLDHGDALRRGEAERDIYGSLKTEIDPARTEFLQTFISKSATMVDYLHLEILGGLAHNDEKLLGLGYPGPMV